ncbi:MAG: hypothetical protein JO108_08550 [Acidobacteriaceae bacterium]|nr:hypothetical protein [Acidobacteriaceae bacterium]
MELLFAVALAGTTLLAAESRVSVVHGDSRFEVAIDAGKVREFFWVHAKSGWMPAAVSAGKTQGSLSIRAAGDAVLPGDGEVTSHGDTGITETLHGEGWTATRTIQAFGERDWYRVVTVLSPSRPLTLHALVDRYEASWKPDWTFSPSVGGFNPDAKYKAPVILVQRGQVAFGIVPDLVTLNRASLQRCNHSLDIATGDTSLLSVGYVPAKQAYHVVFKEDVDRSWTATEPVVNAYYVYLSGNAPLRTAYREIVRFDWAQFGRPAEANAASEQAGTDPKYRDCHLWDEWRKVVWEHESPESWLTIPMPDGTSGGAVMMHRARAPKPSVYLGAWFNALRTAYGMALYARRIGNASLMSLAEQTSNLAMKAPGHDGAFKCFAVANNSSGPADSEQVFWGAGDGAGVSVATGYLGFDMSWTGYWLVKWMEAKLPGSESVLLRCTRLADFLIARQRSDGFVPTRFDEDGDVEESLAATVPAETAPVARFLLELYKVDPNPKYARAGLKALAFLDAKIVPERKWYDFETFWSCSPRLVAFDERTRQWPANNLALIHGVAAYLQAYEITGNRTFLSNGQSLLDYLLLYQQVWTNPVLEHLTGPSMLLGGFTTQNSDAEWSDARQSLAGEVLLDYYRATHNVEYLERGVEALRAQFPVSPSENWAHAGYGPKAGVSSFHWGTGSGMAGIELEEEFLRDAVCDVQANACVGVNGLNITRASISEDGRVELEAQSPFHWSRNPEFVFHNVRTDMTYHVSVNGEPPRSLSGKQLEQGISVAMPRETPEATQ